MPSIVRNLLRRSPIARRGYFAYKRMAHSFLERDQPPSAFAPPVEPAADIVTEPGPEPATMAAPAPTRRVVPEDDLDIYKQYPPHVLYTFQEKHAVFRQALREYSSITAEDEPSGLYTDPVRVVNFFQMISAANALASGDYIELGSHRGFSLRVIHRFMDPSCTLYSLDTFEGFDGRDIEIEQTKYATPWTAGSFAPTSVERVAHYVGDGAWPANLKIIKGWFPDSFTGMEDVRWRFVHIDFDLYRPIRTALDLLWPALLPGGVMMVHDYGCYGFPAARVAVDEFCASIGLAPIELADRWSTAVIRKPFGRTSP